MNLNLIELKNKEDFDAQERILDEGWNNAVILVESEEDGIFGYIAYIGNWQLITSLDASKEYKPWSDSNLYILTIKLSYAFENKKLKYYLLPLVMF